MKIKRRRLKESHSGIMPPSNKQTNQEATFNYFYFILVSLLIVPLSIDRESVLPFDDRFDRFWQI